MKQVFFNVGFAFKQNAMIRAVRSKLLELSAVTADMDVVCAHVKSVISQKQRESPSLRQYKYNVYVSADNQLKFTVDGIICLRTEKIETKTDLFNSIK